MLPHLLIVLLPDGVGVNLCKSKEIQCCVKQTSMMKNVTNYAQSVRKEVPLKEVGACRR